MKFFARWLIAFASFLAVVAGVFVSDLGAMLLEGDRTMISVATLALAIATMSVLGVRLLVAARRRREFVLENYWFVSDMCLTLGLGGTVIGFILMFQSLDLVGIDATAPDAVRGVIAQLAAGLGTALYTTLVGLVCSSVVKLQCRIVEDFFHECVPEEGRDDATV